MKRLMSALMRAGVYLLCAGCTATTVGIGPTAVPGKYNYLTGTLQGTYSAPISRMWPMTQTTMQELRLTVDGRYLDEERGELQGRRADGTPITISLAPVGTHSTTIKVRVGTPGSRELAQYVHRAIQQQLDR